MKGLLFSTDMVEAILRGRKRKTRRIASTDKPPVKVGEIVYVKETFKYGIDSVSNALTIHYKAFAHETANNTNKELEKNWRPSLFMPECASRIHLRIVDVRKEPLCDITEKEAIDEGILHYDCPILHDRFYINYVETRKSKSGMRHFARNAVHSFKTLWDSINGIGEFYKNPDVWVIEFEAMIS